MFYLIISFLLISAGCNASTGFYYTFNPDPGTKNEFPFLERQRKPIAGSSASIQEIITQKKELPAGYTTQTQSWLQYIRANAGLYAGFKEALTLAPMLGLSILSIFCLTQTNQRGEWPDPTGITIAIPTGIFALIGWTGRLLQHNSAREIVIAEKKQ